MSKKVKTLYLEDAVINFTDMYRVEVENEVVFMYYKDIDNERKVHGRRFFWKKRASKYYQHILEEIVIADKEAKGKL